MSPPFRPSKPGADDNPECGPHAAFRGLFGRHSDGPFGRWRGSRMFDSGALRLLVLGLIAEEPRHGYGIIRGLRARFQGSYSPSPGSIYPILQQLSEAGLVASSSHGPRRRFTVTEAGKAWLAEQSAELDAIKAQLDTDRRARDRRGDPGTARSALLQDAQGRARRRTGRPSARRAGAGAARNRGPLGGPHSGTPPGTSATRRALSVMFSS